MIEYLDVRIALNTEQYRNIHDLLDAVREATGKDTDVVLVGLGVK